MHSTSSISVYALEFAKKIDLANLNSIADKLDIDKLNNVPSNLSNLKSWVRKLDNGKLETTPVDLSKLSDAVEYVVVTNTEYNELDRKVNAIKTNDTSELAIEHRLQHKN